MEKITSPPINRAHILLQVKLITERGVIRARVKRRPVASQEGCCGFRSAHASIIRVKLWEKGRLLNFGYMIGRGWAEDEQRHRKGPEFSADSLRNFGKIWEEK